MLTKIKDIDGKKAVFRCSCGNTKTLWKSNVKPGHTQSCGCFRKKATALRCTTHGHNSGYQKTPTYVCWKSMRQRCRNPKVRNFEHYGGRGIRVSERWDCFENFIADMGEVPAGMTLDRIDVNGDYGPDNCRWATRIEQMNNRRNNRMIKHEGLLLTLAEWARRAGVKYHTLMARLDSGMSIERALSTGMNLRRKEAFFPTNDATTGLVRIA